jgi:hypothetical protein
VSTATAATIAAAGTNGTNGTQLPVAARVTASSVTAPAATPATRPVTMTNRACQPNTAATCRRVAPTRPSRRTTRRRSTVATASVVTRDTAASAATTPRIRLLPNAFCAVACSAWALATPRLVTRHPGWPAVSPARAPGAPPLTRICANPGGAPVCPAVTAAGISTSPDASARAYTALTVARYGVPSGRYTVIREPTCTPIAPGAASSELTAICPGRSAVSRPEVTPRSRTRPGSPATASP